MNRTWSSPSTAVSDGDVPSWCVISKAIRNEIIRRIRLRKISGRTESLPDELIKKSFKGCALTTVPGGSEDHLIHCFKTNSEVPSGLDALKKARMERSLEELEDLIEEVDLGEEEYQEDSSLISD
ncbi:unnamed protein product [Caenorhabditis nigoni]